MFALFLIVYNVEAWDATKYLVISNTVNLGWSAFFGFFLISGAAFSLILIMILAICQYVRGNKLQAKYDDLKWD